MKFNPYELVKNYDIQFITGQAINKEIRVNKDYWPENLIYNEQLSSLDDNVEEFNEYIRSDTTLIFYIESAIGRVKSLISRATNYDPPSIIEHSDIHIFFLDDKPDDNDKPFYMTRTKTVLYLRTKKNET
jgi:hypothetical protein